MIIAIVVGIAMEVVINTFASSIGKIQGKGIYRRLILNLCHNFVHNGNMRASHIRKYNDVKSNFKALLYHKPTIKRMKLIESVKKFVEFFLFDIMVFII